MYGLTTIKGMFKRVGLAAFAIAMLLSLAAAPARAQRSTSGPDFQFQSDASIGLASGQTLRLRFAEVDSQGRLIFGTDGGVYRSGVNAHVKVFDGSTGSLLLSHELGSLAAGLHTIDINRADLPAAGDPRTGRIQLWIEVLIFSRTDGRAPAGKSATAFYAPTLEVIDSYGRTTVHGGVWKTTNFLTTD